jgi:hypothetical protein
MGLPMAAWRVIGDPRAARAAGLATKQIGGDPGLVNEEVPCRIVKRHRLTPSAAIRRDIRSTLFVGVYCFF